MSVASRITNVAILGLLISLCLYSDQGFGHVGAAEQIVDTDPQVVLELGTRGILPCRIQRRGYSVDWKRQLSSETELLVSLSLFFDVGERDWHGYEAGLFNITDDYSLVIKDVKVQDEGLYICTFIDHQTGKVFRNSTIVFVQAFPDEPFPVIQECIGKDVNSGACSLATHQTLNLTCLVRGYYPYIDLSFLHGSEKVTPTEYEEWNNVDGTKNKEIRVQISVSDEPYECVASGLPGMVENRSVSVIVQARSPGANVAAIIAPVLMVVGISLSIAVFFLYRHRNNRGNFTSQGYIAVNREEDILSRFNDNIHKVAEAISDDRDLRRLGAELGLEHSTISRAIMKNWEDGPKTTNGNNWMLRKWASTITRSDLLVPTLRAALDRAGLADIVLCLRAEHEHLRAVKPTDEGHFGVFCRKVLDPLPEGNIGAQQDNSSDQSAPALKTKQGKGEHGEDETMPDDIASLREKLKTRYLKKYGEIKTSPADPNSSTWLNTIFVGLVLILKTSLLGAISEEDICTRIDVDGLYKLINTNTPKGFITRIAFMGKVGMGKSTLFCKIALDWAMGKALQNVNLLFFESFQDMEKNPSFGNIIMNQFPEMKASESARIDQYIQENQRKVAILINDLDEKKMDLTVPDSENVVLSIVRGEKFTDTPLLINTRPYVVDLIKSDDNIGALYALIEVQGFSKENSVAYIKKFFQNDEKSAVSLLKFIESNHHISEYLTPFPMLCSMLCNVWGKATTQEALKKLETFSQVLKEICFSLAEQYFSKRGKSNQYESFMKKANYTIISVGKIALEGLMQENHVFTEEGMQEQKEDLITACEIGVLSREKRLAPRSVRLKTGKQYTEVFTFPHHFIQEYAASYYLIWLFHHNLSEFNRILTENLLKDYKKFKYVSFFTASLGGEVGKSVMEAACQTVRDINFLIKVAFECHDPDALDPIKQLLLRKRSISTGHTSDYAISATSFALQTYGKEVIEEVDHRPPEVPSMTLSTEDLSNDAGSYWDDTIVQYTKALFNMPNCRSLLLANHKLEKDLFFSTMASEADKSQIMSLKHEGGSLSPKASAQYAKAITSMPNLQNLELSDVELSSDDFYPKMADGASQSRIVTLKHEGGKVSKDASAQYAKAIFSMPNLQNLELCNVKLSDVFYLQPTLPKQASNTKLKKLKHVGGSLGSDASSNYAKCLSSMPDLKSLEVENVKLHDKFYKRASTEASKSKVEVLRHADAELGPDASSYYGQALFSMQNLRSLELERVNLSDEFFSTMSTSTSKSEIVNLRHADGVLSSTSSYNYAKGLFSMPRLQSLELTRMKLTDGFFKVMSTDATNSQIEKLKHTDADLSHDASYDYGRGLCTMPKLQTLELLKVNLKDKFSESVATEASRAKIQTLIMKWCRVNSRILRAMLSLPLLQSLSLVDKLDLPDDIDERRVMNLGTSCVNNLSVDGRSVAGLWKLGLHKSCPRVKKLTLCFDNEDLDSSDTISTACSPFQQLTELHVDWQNTLDPPEFCRAVKRSCPKLTKLTLTRIELNNDKATEIIQTMKTHPYLTIIEMDSCWTDEYLDPIITEVNREVKLTVNVRHGPN